MAVRRRQIPRNIAVEVLFRAEHTCCICRTKGKDVQIHHIDGNHSNNAINNLAVVCLECHSRVTGKRGLGTSYKVKEVRKYKSSWEKQVFDSRRIHRPIIRYQREFIGQIDLIVCEILACSEKNNQRAQELLELLYELVLWRGNYRIKQRVIDGLSHLALMSGLMAPRLAAMVAEKLYQMCWHFMDPDEIPMKKRDLNIVLDCISALETLAVFNCEFGHGRKATEKIAENGEYFFDIGLNYSRRSIANAIIKMYERGLQACYQDGKLIFKFGRIKIHRSLHHLLKRIIEEKPDWKYQKGRLKELLSS
jgi:hypothetical protein